VEDDKWVMLLICIAAAYSADPSICWILCSRGDVVGTRKYGFSFSWKRALGISSARNKLARMTGIPTTRSGLERKVGRAVTGGGCLLLILLFIALPICMIMLTR